MKDHCVKIGREWFLHPEYFFAALQIRPIFSRRIDALKLFRRSIIDQNKSNIMQAENK
jgi:hypothetical protein